MAEKSIKITIATALNAAGFTAARRAISNLVSGTKDFAAKVGGNLMNIKAGFDMVAGAASKLMQVMSKGMEFERMTVTFKSLTGSMELAKAHMKDLQDLGRTPPFSLEAFASASQMLMKMTDGMLGYKKSLEMVGDIAAATGNDISQVGRSVGLAYQMIRDGQPFVRAGSQMVQLGILTKAQIDHFDALSKSGKNNMAVWEELTKVLSKYKGAMAETEKTAKGVVEAIQGEATVAITDFSSAITESAKPALEGLLGYMKRINEDGTIEDWADATVEKLGEVGKVAKTVGDIFGWFWKSAKTVGAHVSAFREGTKLADEMGIKGDARGAFARNFRKDVIDEIWGRNESANKDKADYIESRKESKTKKLSAERAKAEAEAEKRIRDDMAKAQAETTAKFEKARQDAIDETMAKLREMDGMDADVDVSVNVEEPKPVSIDVIEPAPIKPNVIKPDSIDVKVNEPKDVKINVEEPKPVSIDVIEPAPIKPNVIKPDSIDVKVNDPKDVKINVEDPKPVVVKAVSPDAVKVRVEDPPEVSINVKEPNPINVKAIAPDPIGVIVEKPDAVKIDVEKPEPVTVKAKAIVDDDGFAELEDRMKTIPELIKPDMSGVKRALADLAKATTEEELKAAKDAVDTAMKKQKADDEAFKNLQAKMRESNRNAAEFVAAYEKDQEEAAKNAAKEEADAKMKEMKKLHDERMKQLDKEAEKVKKQIDDAKAKGFDNLMATAGGGAWDNGTLDQAGDIREERQKKIGEERASKAEDALKAKIAKLGATLDDPSKLGRMSNLERAAFERLKLKDAEAKAAKIQNEKDAREKKMSEDIDAINKRLKEVGL